MKNHPIPIWGAVIAVFLLFLASQGNVGAKNQGIKGKTDRGADFVYYFTSRPAWQRNQVRWQSVVWAEDWNFPGSREPFYILHLSDGTALTVRDAEALSVISERLKDGHTNE